eukprot:2362385-Rhodomonas_salina.2
MDQEAYEIQEREGGARGAEGKIGRREERGGNKGENERKRLRAAGLARLVNEREREREEGEREVREREEREDPDIRE